MLYLQKLTPGGSSITAGIYTLSIPAGSSSPSSGPLVLVASFDPAADLELYALPFTLTAVTEADPASLNWSDPYPAAVAIGTYTTTSGHALVQTANVTPLPAAAPGT